MPFFGRPLCVASGSVSMFIQTILGLDFTADEARVRLPRPRLPDYVGWLTVRGLGHHNGEIDFRVHRNGD